MHRPSGPRSNQPRHFLGLTLGFSLACCGVAGAQAEPPAAGVSMGDCAGKTLRDPYAGTFYANDFSYVGDPCLPATDSRDRVSRFTDRAKRIELGPDAVADFGGEARVRYQDENDMARSRLDGQDNSFALTRLRFYGNLEVGEHLRFFGEAIDARSLGEDFAPRNTEEVHTDLLNGFAEVRGDLGPARGYVRGGRQELLFGAQRLISPLDWSNTRRSFDGGRASVVTDSFDASAWYVFPRVIDNDFSSETDDDTDFSGVYATYRHDRDFTFDGYALRLERDDSVSGGKTIWTLGGRHAGRARNVFWEIEAAYQFGEEDAGQDGPDQDVGAAMFTAGIGYDFAEQLPWKPSLSLYYDLATGDDDPDDGDAGTFDQLFPLAHAYLGFMDLVGRRNIEALSLRLTAQPHPRLKLALAGHHFALESKRDALYNAGGAPIRHDPTGRAGTEVGQELDLTATISLLDRVALQLGYSRFWGGNFIDATNPLGVSGNADFFYTQLTARL